jgi:hypothetical protein
MIGICGDRTGEETTANGNCIDLARICRDNACVARVCE